MMQFSVPLSSVNLRSAGLAPLITLVGARYWKERLTEIRDLVAPGPRAGQALRQRHCVELSLDKLRRNPPARLSVTEALLGQIAAEIPLIATELTDLGRDRLIQRVRLGLSGQNTLIPVFHLIRTALLQRDRGFTVTFPGLENATPHDLLLSRNKIEAEVACDVVTAEEGRGLHRGAWFRLADRIDPDLQIWLAAHPGRYLLKMTLSNGLRGGLDGSDGDQETVSHLHQRITAMLQTTTRHDHDEAIVLRLDPLLCWLVPRLRTVD
jgi:hypothetical protein